MQQTFDTAFELLARSRDAFVPRLVPREVGTITSVDTGVAHVSGLPGVGYAEVIRFPGGVWGIAFNVDDNEIGVVLLGVTMPTCMRATRSSARAG